MAQKELQNNATDAKQLISSTVLPIYQPDVVKTDQNEPPRFNVEVLHISKSGSISDHIRYTDKEKFDFDLESVVPEDRLSSLILVEDLSPDALKSLKHNFKLDLGFLENHMADTQNFKTGKWKKVDSPDIDIYPSLYKHVNFYSLHFTRQYSMPGGADELCKLRKATTNTPRGAYIAHGLLKIAVQEKVSVHTTIRNSVKIGRLLKSLVNLLITCQGLY
jgi:hypothetical protein